MKILLLNSREPILQILKRCFEKCGHEALVIDDSPALLADLTKTIEEWKPDALITNNFDFMSSNPEADAIEDMLRRKGLLSISWFFESPEIAGGSQFLGRWIQKRHPQYFIVAASDSYFLDFYKSHGMEAFYLPMAVDPNAIPENPVVWQPQDSSDLFFSGAAVSGGIDKVLDDASLTDFYINWCLNDLEQLRGLPLGKEVEELFYQQLNALFGLKNRFDGYFRSSRRSWSKAHDSLQQNEIDRIVWNIFGARVDYLFSGYQLTQSLRDIRKNLPLKINGAIEWSVLVPGLETPPQRLNPAELFEAFGSHFATLCMTKQTFQRFIHERIWMILACGGFPITDEREDLWKFFDRGDLATYRYTSEIPELYHFYLKNLSLREKIILKGREMVLRDHTYDNRAQELLQKIGSLTGKSCRPTERVEQSPRLT